MKLFKLALVLSAFTAFACSPKYYSPNTQQVTLFEEQGDINVSVISGGSRFEGQAAYAITDQFAAAVNYAKFIPREVNDAGSGSGSIFEIAPGYYKNVGDNMIFEGYLQLGFGNFENEFFNQFDTIPTGNKITANAFRIGIQPSLAYKKENFAVALSTRVSSLNYSKIEGNLIYQGVDQIKFLEDNKSNLLIEPALTCWFGFEKFKLQAQYSLSFNTSNSEFPSDNSVLTLGVNANINPDDF